MNILMDSLNLVQGESTAVCVDTPAHYSWGAQIRGNERNKVAWFSWLIEGSKALSADLAMLLEFLIREAGLMGMETCAVTLDEGHWVAAAFRQVGFSIINRQLVMRKTVPASNETAKWEPVHLEPFSAVDRFYESQIPAAIKQMGCDWGGGNVFALRNGTEIRAVAKVTDDQTNKLYIEPIYHPGEENPSALISSLAAQLLPERELEVRVMIPGFQAWLTDAFEADGFTVEYKQQTFIKNLTVKMEEPVLRVAEKQVLQLAGSRQFSLLKRKDDK